MKILIPVLGFTKSGGFRVLSKMADRLAQENYDVVFLCSAKGEPYFPTSVKIIYCEFLPFGKNIIFSMINLYFGLIRIKYTSSFDYILGNHSLTALPIYLSRISGKRLYYIQAYEPDYYRLKKGFWNNKILFFLSSLSYKLPFRQIVNSYSYLNNDKLRAVDVILPGLDMEIFKPRPKIGKGNFIVGSILRGEESKGSQYILEAYQYLSDKFNDIEWRFAFVDEKFKNKISNEEDFLPNGDEQLAEYYSGLDVYISAGISQPGAVHYPVIECMACYTAVITTPFYPANSGNAQIILPKSTDDIINSIIEMKNRNNIEGLKDRALEDVQEFDWSFQWKKLLEIIK